jgi:hypothetical protein
MPFTAVTVEIETVGRLRSASPAAPSRLPWVEADRRPAGGAIPYLFGDSQQVASKDWCHLTDAGWG